MSIQHKDIPNAQLHEAKGISTAANKAALFADGAGSGAWRLVTESDISYATKTSNKFGWNYLVDSLYTSGSPRAIAASARTQLTNNGAGALTDVSRLGALWNTGTNVYLINDLNAAYELRINFKATAAASTLDAYRLAVELESATGTVVFASNTLSIKGGGGINLLQSEFSFPVYSSINNANTKIYVTPDTDIALYDISYFLRRSYKES